MRYTLERFNQEQLIIKGLDEKDIFILAWFSDFMFSSKMTSKIIDQKEYFWIKYQAVLDDLPILKIGNREVIARRFNKYVKSKVVEKKLIKNASGTYTFFRISDGYFDLLSPHSTQKSSPPDSKVESAPDSKVDPKDSSTINPSTKTQYTDDFLSWFNTYPKEKDNTRAGAFKWWKKKSKQEKNDIVLATEAYKKEIKTKGTKNQFIIAARNFIGRDERYLDYLELAKKSEEKKEEENLSSIVEKKYYNEIQHDVNLGLSRAQSISFYLKKYKEENGIL